MTCQTTIAQENWYFLLLINTLFAWHLGAANLIAVKILFFFVSRYENLGKLCMHFELQVGSPWTNLAEIWQIVDRWVTYKTVSANLNSSFHFKVIAYFLLVVAIIPHSLIYLKFVFWKVFQGSSNYFSFHRHFKKLVFQSVLTENKSFICWAKATFRDIS